jgi:hypothetical protein
MHGSFNFFKFHFINLAEPAVKLAMKELPRNSHTVISSHPKLHFQIYSCMWFPNFTDPILQWTKNER